MMEKQKQFITNASHELKTPVTVILSNVEALELYTNQTKWSIAIAVMLHFVFYLYFYNQQHRKTHLNILKHAIHIVSLYSVMNKPLKTKTK